MHLKLIDDSRLWRAEVGAFEFVCRCIGTLLQLRNFGLGLPSLLEHVGAEILVELQDLQLCFGDLAA